MKRLYPILAALALAACAAAQTFPHVTTQQITVSASGQPSPVTGGSVRVVGAPGSATYYIWVVAKFTVGHATPSQAIVAGYAANVLTASNYLAVAWGPVAGATGYDVLMTSSPSQPTGACGCLAGTTVAPNLNIITNSTSAYTVNTWSGNTEFDITNGANGAGESILNFTSDHGAMLGIDNLLGPRAPQFMFPVQAPPSNPPSGFDTIFASTADGKVHCLTSAGVECLSGGGGGGVTTFQADSNTPLSGAVQMVSGNALYTTQAGQAFTVNVANATTGSVGVLALAQDLGGTFNAPTVLGFDGVALKPGTPSNGQAWVYNSTDGKYELATAGASPGGSDTQVQYNNAGTLAGTPQITITPTGAVVTTPSAADVPLTINGVTSQSGDLLEVYNAAAGALEFYVTAFGGGTFRGNLTAAGGAFGVNANTGVVTTAGVTHVPSLFSAAPPCSSGNEGTSWAVTDSTVNTWGSIVTGGGTDHVLMYCDGTSWTVQAK